MLFRVVGAGTAGVRGRQETLLYIVANRPDAYAGAAGELGEVVLLRDFVHADIISA